MEGGPPSAGSLDESRSDEPSLATLDPDQIVREAHVAQLSISDLIQRKRRDFYLPKKKKKPIKKSRRKETHQSKEFPPGEL